MTDPNRTFTELTAGTTDLARELISRGWSNREIAMLLVPPLDANAWATALTSSIALLVHRAEDITHVEGRVDALRWKGDGR